jgi:beta-phosphoglucomutase
MVKAVIFDLDGVLVTTDEMHYRAWKQLADEHGIPFDRAANSRLRGVSRMESLEIILERADQPYTPEQKHQMAARKNDCYRGLLASLTPDDVLPGAREMLAELRSRGILIAVGSSSKNAPTILERVGLTDLIDALVDGNQIHASKPDPEVFLLAAKALGVRPEECVVVEDAAAGIEAARRAGMTVFGIGEPGSLPGVADMARNLSEATVEGLLCAGP